MHGFFSIAGNTMICNCYVTLRIIQARNDSALHNFTYFIHSYRFVSSPLISNVKIDMPQGLSEFPSRHRRLHHWAYNTGCENQHYVQEEEQQCPDMDTDTNGLPCLKCGLTGCRLVVIKTVDRPSLPILTYIFCWRCVFVRTINWNNQNGNGFLNQSLSAVMGC